MCVIDWWDYGHAFFDAFELEGNVSKAPLKLSNEGAGGGERGLQPQAWREGFLQYSALPMAAGQLLIQKPWLPSFRRAGRTSLWRLSILD